MSAAAAPSARLGWIDSARGLALWAMFGFHLTWDFAHFGWIDPATPYTAGFHWLGHAIATSFLLLVGVSLVLARQARGPLLQSRAFWRRWAMLAAAAGAISAASFWLFPDTPIFFGILHCIALSSLIAAPLVEAPALVALGAGVAALAAPLFLAAPMFDAKIFWWTGLGTFEPSSNDYRPLLPWLGVVLIGVALAKYRLVGHGWRSESVRSAASHDQRSPRHGGPVAKALAFCGRHSLAFYLIHQPALFGLFSLLALFAVSPAQERLFVSQCAAQCLGDAGEADICERTCACTVRRAKTHGYWPQMARDALSPAQKTLAHDDIIACFGDSRGK